jgi:hypothetical protein
MNNRNLLTLMMAEQAPMKPSPSNERPATPKEEKTTKPQQKGVFC